ncbi:chitooligosaccharidolytic beta-N-acetylglucosaminidase-like isoform X2 [Anopheles albimanus]|uniref:chitooligosaccharidolytic beta-N-acetylglucosaminidase-like isoform X2 n=1 Tax=Anopheles albimanus TaxID=7167 RepID=UPI00163E143C|nr:chitooligosaccharidolytic beta-N-acetylglucosaminidase-like isoform X2 [Anopheles albimanus]
MVKLCKNQHNDFYNLSFKPGKEFDSNRGTVELGKLTTAIHPDNIRLEADKTINSTEVLEMLNQTHHQFVSNLRNECSGQCKKTNTFELTVKVFVATSEAVLSWTTDESYRLNISASDVKKPIAIVEAVTMFGARHAIETLSQLTVAVSHEESEDEFNSLHISTQAFIIDAPVYAHRGLMLDTARNFIPITAIQRQLDGMAASKLNVLHWHITDTHSFPIVLKRVPEAALFGSYSSEALYSLTDIRSVVNYARQKGVRIIFEFDAPAHAGNGWQWGPQMGLGDLAVCVNQLPWRNYCIEPPCGQLNPVNPNLYLVLEKLYMDLAEIDPQQPIIHMGGDEVFYNCWNESEAIVKYLKDHGKGRTETDFLSLWRDFQEKNLHLWDYSRKTVEQTIKGTIDLFKPAPVILWSSHLTDPSVINRYLTNDRYVIQTWVPTQSSLNEDLLNLGYQLIISTKNAWYLDHGFWGQTSYYNWKIVYNNRLPRKDGVLGGEVSLWTEFVDQYSIDGRIWPRAAAAAERLWSDPYSTAQEAEGRFYRHRNRLISRGIQPDAVISKWCEQNEGQCF